MNLNDFARTITLEEKGKVEMSIAQAKELLRIILTELGKSDDGEILKVINRYRK